MSQKTTRKILVVILIIAVAGCFLLPLGMMSFGASESSVRKQMSEVQKEKKTVASDITKLENKIKKEKKAIKSLQTKINKKDKSIDKAQKELAQTKSDLAKTKNLLNQRVRAMYKNGSVGYMEILLGSKDVSELITNVELVKNIYKGDQAAIADLKEHKNDVQKKEAALTAEKKELTEEKSELKDTQADLNSSKSQLKKKYQGLLKEEEALRKQIDQIVAAKQVTVQKTITNANGKTSTKSVTIKLPTTYGNGKFIWPVHGTITCEFGTQRSYERHPGMDIAVPTGTPVRAAASGTVIIANWYGGYGNAVSISHGSGLTTIYGHNSRLAVSVGQHVKQGQVIAYAGSTGWSTGPHCHFEVRKNGTAVNPRNYL